MQRIPSDIDEIEFIAQFLRQCEAYVAFPEFTFKKQFDIEGYIFNLYEDLLFNNIFDLSFNL